MLSVRDLGSFPHGLRDPGQTVRVLGVFPHGRGERDPGSEGDDSLVDEDGAEDEDADGSDAVDDNQDLEIEAVAEMGYEPGQAIPITG